MRIPQVHFFLLFLSFAFMMSCNSIDEVSPDEIGFIDESLLEPVDISFEEMEKGNQLMRQRDPNCKFLGRIRQFRTEGDCKFLIELRSGRYVNPINALDIFNEYKNGRFVYLGVERVEEGPCDKGMPVYVTCISRISLKRDSFEIVERRIVGKKPE